MSLISLSNGLQLVAGLGLLNVWLVRAHARTSYRGGAAQTLRQEFAAYRLPAMAFYIVGALKIVAGLVLIAAVWLPLPTHVAAGVVAALMVGALFMHVRVKDPARKSVPAAFMLALCAGILALP